EPPGSRTFSSPRSSIVAAPTGTLSLEIRSEKFLVGSPAARHTATHQGPNDRCESCDKASGRLNPVLGLNGARAVTNSWHSPMQHAGRRLLDEAGHVRFQQPGIDLIHAPRFAQAAKKRTGNFSGPCPMV